MPYKLKFGLYRNQLVTQAPTDYLQYLLGLPELYDDTRAGITAELERREREHDPGPPSKKDRDRGNGAPPRSSSPPSGRPDTGGDARIRALVRQELAEVLSRFAHSLREKGS